MAVADYVPTYSPATAYALPNDRDASWLLQSSPLTAR